MATVSTLASPGVEVREYDESLRINTSTGTTVFVPGFASQGPVEEITPIGTMDDFENIYGAPTNAAERYFYYTVKSILDKNNDGVTVLTSRIAYGAGDGDNVSNAFTLLAYPSVPVIKNSENTKGYDYWSVAEDAIKKLVTLKNGSSTTHAPKTVETDVVINNAYKDLKNFHLTKLLLSIEGETSGHLPSAGASLTEYKGVPKLTWCADSSLVTKHDEHVSNGVISTETEGKDTLVVNLVFTLTLDNVQIGFIKITSKYENINEAYNTLSFNTDNGSTTSVDVKYVPAFKVGEYYSSEGVKEKPEEYDDVTYVLGSPVAYQISLSEYYQLISGELFAWSNEPYQFTAINSEKKDDDKKFGMFNALKHAAMIAVNPSRTIVNDSFEGYYFGLTDNMFNTTVEGVTLNAIDSVKITTLNSNQESDGKGLLEDAYETISKGRLDFYLDSNNKGSLSQILQNEINSFDISSVEYDDTINFALFKLKKSTTANEIMKLTYGIVEKYNASLGKTRQYSISTATNPQSYFVENLLENSSNITILVNPYIAKNIFVDINNNLRGKVRIFSNKLVSNLTRLQEKYVLGYTTTVSSINPDKTINAPVNAAKSSLNSWKQTMAQAGVSLDILSSFVSPTYATFVECNSLYPFGTYTANKTANKFIGNVPYKLERTLTLISNDETYPDIDIICDGGLSTIYTYSNTDKVIGNNTMVVDAEQLVLETGKNARTFDETAILAGIEDLRTGRTSYSEYAQAVIEDYMAVQQSFMNIANSETNGGRGNTFYIADLLRGIFIKGKNTKVSNLFGSPLTNSSYDDGDTVNHSWSTSILYPIKHLTENFTTSFASSYAQWFKVLDNFSGEKVWLPGSGKVAAKMCQTDASVGPWEAAAGLNRGIIDDALDLALNPTLPQRSDLYKLCVNSIPSMPNAGPVIWGIRTMSKKASAFDQNTCRRTFLYMEKRIKQVLRYFVFERNNSYTQLRVYNELDPFLDSLLAQGAIYDYKLVCDSTNNTEEIINAGCLVVSVSAAPQRVGENIILNMTANKYTNTITTSITTV